MAARFGLGDFRHEIFAQIHRTGSVVEGGVGKNERHECRLGAYGCGYVRNERPGGGRIKAGPVAPLVIILTLYDHPDYRSQSKMAGADGFVSKADFGAKLLPLIDSFRTALARQLMPGRHREVL